MWKHFGESPHLATFRKRLERITLNDPSRKVKAIKSYRYLLPNGGDVLRREAVNPRDMSLSSFSLQQGGLRKPVVNIRES